MEVKLGRFINYWDEAALSTLGSEFYMNQLLDAQLITNADGSSVLDNITFEDGLVITVPESTEEEVKYFKAPWED